MLVNIYKAHPVTLRASADVDVVGGGGGAQAFRKSLGMSSDNHSGINWDVTSGGSPIWQH